MEVLSLRSGDTWRAVTDEVRRRCRAPGRRGDPFLLQRPLRAKENEQGEPGHLGRSGRRRSLRRAFARDFRKTAGSRKKRRIRPTASAGGASGSSTRSTAREFVPGRPEFATSVGPGRGLSAAAGRGLYPHGTSCSRRKGKGPGTGAARLRVSTRARLEGAHILASRSEVSPGPRTAARSGDGRIDRERRLQARAGSRRTRRPELERAPQEANGTLLRESLLVVRRRNCTDVARRPRCSSIGRSPGSRECRRPNPELARWFSSWAAPKKPEGRIQ